MKIHHAWFQKHFICEKEWFVFKDRTKELKDLSLWLTCHQDVKYSTTLLKVAGREFFLWTQSVLELLYQNEFHSTIVCTSEQENVSLYAVFKAFYSSYVRSAMLLSSPFQFILCGGAQIFSYYHVHLQNDSDGGNSCIIYFITFKMNDPFFFIVENSQSKKQKETQCVLRT